MVLTEAVPFSVRGSLGVDVLEPLVILRRACFNLLVFVGFAVWVCVPLN